MFGRCFHSLTFKRFANMFNRHLTNVVIKHFSATFYKSLKICFEDVSMFYHLNVLPRCLMDFFKRCDNIFLVFKRRFSKVVIKHFRETFYKRFKICFEDVLTFTRLVKMFKRCFSNVVIKHFYFNNPF